MMFWPALQNFNIFTIKKVFKARIGIKSKYFILVLTVKYHFLPLAMCLVFLFYDSLLYYFQFFYHRDLYSKLQITTYFIEPSFYFLFIYFCSFSFQVVSSVSLFCLFLCCIVSICNDLNFLPYILNIILLVYVLFC